MGVALGVALGVAPPGTLGSLRSLGASPGRHNDYHPLIIYALVIVTNNYITKNKGRRGAKPPPQRVAKQRASVPGGATPSATLSIARKTIPTP